jgi:hypothetical protein
LVLAGLLRNAPPISSRVRSSGQLLRTTKRTEKSKKHHVHRKETSMFKEMRGMQ